MRELFEDPSWERPSGWVWHHLGDGRTLQLVPLRLHAELPHTGMAACALGSRPPPCPGPPASPLPLLDPGPPLPPRAIQRVEATLEVRLPEPYKRLLQAGNGGRPAAAALRSAAGADEVVDRFLALGSGDDYDLVAWLELYAERLPDGFFPVAGDPFGNLIGIDLSPRSPGSVLFWDHELEPDPEKEPEEREDVGFLAADFAELLSRFFVDQCPE